MPPRPRVSLTNSAVPPAKTEASPLWGDEAARQEIVALPVDQIMPNPRQPRTVFDPAALNELAASIQLHGIVQPIIVRPISVVRWEGATRRYELIAGERRWRASQIAAQGTIPAIIRADVADHERLIELALIENLQRADLGPFEEAAAFGTMRDELGYSVRRTAERVGRSKGYVEKRLKLLELAPDLQELAQARPDTLMHVVELARLPDGDARAQLVAAVQDGLSFVDTQAKVRALLYSPAPDADDDATVQPLLVSLRRDTSARAHAADDSAQVSLRRDTPPPDVTRDPRAPILLDPHERRVLRAMTEKLDAWSLSPFPISSDDQATLTALAQRISEVLAQGNKQ